MAQTARKIEKQGELLSKSAIAKRCKLHVQTVTTRLGDLGYVPDSTSTAKNQLYWFDDEMEFAIKSAKDAYAAMKIRGMRVVAEGKELDLAIKRRDYVETAEAVGLVQRIVKTIYEEYTVRQPKRIAPKLAKAKNVIEVKQVLKADTARIMKSLRENFERFIG